MAAKKKTAKSVEEVLTEQVIAPVEEVQQEEIAPVEEKKVTPEDKKDKKSKKEPKYKIGSIVYISKNVEADLNGFNLFISQYRKETYTVEAYDGDTGVYKVRHLKLLLSLKEDDLVSPDENAHDKLNRIQF